MAATMLQTSSNAERRRSRKDPGQEFREAVRDVQPLPDTGRVVHAPSAAHAPAAPAPEQDDRQVLPTA